MNNIVVADLSAVFGLMLIYRAQFRIKKSTSNSKFKIQNSKPVLYLSFITLCFSLLTFCGCARGSLESPTTTTKLVFKLTFTEKIDTQTVGYVLAFNTDNTDGTHGPFINNPTNIQSCIDGNYLDSSGQDSGATDLINSNLTTYLLSFVGGNVTLTELVILSDGSIQQTPTPFTDYYIVDNTITINLNPDLIKNPATFTANLFTFTLDNTNNIRCVKDGLGNPTSDANILIFDTAVDTFREIQDDDTPALSESDLMFNIEKVSVLKTQI